jgi:arginyl-tRNA synthetase
MVEFVSANPTGPMHMGNARGGVVGDTLSTILQYSGCDITREFYVNDSGNQVNLLAKSLYVRYVQHFKGEDSLTFPEDGYHGEDVKERAAEYAAVHGDKLLNVSEAEAGQELVAYTLKKNIEKMREDLKEYKIHYDRWFFESELHKSGYVDETVHLLTERGCTYEQDGALWFAASRFGCEKDEVLRKSNGFYTYYAVDIAYHRNKFEKRGFDQVIDVFGADHHGHTLRFRAGMAALAGGFVALVAALRGDRHAILSTPLSLGGLAVLAIVGIPLLVLPVIVGGLAWFLVLANGQRKRRS